MEDKKNKNKNTILGMKSSFMDTVNLKKRQKTRYKNAIIPMEQDIEAEASSSKSTINTNETEENEFMEISASREATPERNFQKENENKTENTAETEEEQENMEKNNNPEETNKEKVKTNEEKNFFNTGFITLESNKGKEKANEIDENNNIKENEKEDDNSSILSTDTNLSEHEKWRIETNAKRYKAWIKLQLLKGKNNTEKTNYLLDEIKNKEIQWINLSREKNPNEKGVHLTLTFNNEEDLQKILQLNLESTETNKKIKMTRAPLLKRSNNKYTITNSVVKFWDVPIKVNRQIFLQMVENKFGKIKSSSARLNGLYHTFWIEFETQQIAEEILEQKSQIVGDECVRVTTPEIKYADLVNLKKTGFAAKVIDVPPSMTAAELFSIMKHIGAQTCYMPITRNGNKKGTAILNFESQEIRDEAVGKGYQVDQFMIKIVPAKTKVCHQCKSADHIVKDCVIAKENKEREFRQKQNYQRFNQIYKRYQPKIYNTLSNKYTEKHNTYAEVTQRRTNFNGQNQQPLNQRSNNEVLQALEGISRRLNSIEENINHLNERVDAIQYDQSNVDHINQEKIRNLNNPNNNVQEREIPKQQNEEENQEEEKGNNAQDGIAQCLNQIMNKLGNMENQIANAHQRIDRATGGNNYNQPESIFFNNNNY